MNFSGNDGNFGRMGTSYADSTLSASNFAPTDFVGWVPPGYSAMTRGPVPNPGNADNAMVTYTTHVNEEVNYNCAARKWDNESDNRMPDGAPMFSFLEAELEGKGVRPTPRSTVGTHAMVNWALESGSVYNAQEEHGIELPKSSGFDPHTSELFAFRPTDGSSSASAAVKKIRLVGLKGPDDNGVRQTSNPNDTRVFTMANAGCGTVLNTFAPKLERGDKLYYVVKEVIARSESILDAAGKPTALKPDYERYALQTVPFSKGKCAPMGCELTDRQYQAERMGPQTSIHQPSVMSRDYIAFSTKIDLKRFDREVGADGKLMVVERPTDDFMFANLYQIGEAFKVGTVWEQPPRTEGAIAQKDATRNHTSLELMPSARIVIRPELL